MFHFDNPIVTSNLSHWNKVFLPKMHNFKPVTLTLGLLSSCLQILRFTFITKSDCTKCNNCIPDLLPPFVTSYNWHITNKINLPKRYFSLSSKYNPSSYQNSNYYWSLDILLLNWNYYLERYCMSQKLTVTNSIIW